MKTAERKFNYARKSWHVLGLIIPIFLYADPLRNTGLFIDPTRFWSVNILIVSILGLLVMDYFRLKNNKFRSLFYRFFGSLMKEEEDSRVNATIPYMTANLILFMFFSSEVAVLSCILLIFGDPFAAYVGMKYGRTRMKNGKSLEGFFAFLVFSFISAFIFILFHSFHTNSYDAFLIYRDTFHGEILLILFAGCIAAGIAEFFSSTWFHGFIDDNLLIPVVSAAGISFVAFIFFDFPFDSLFYNPSDVFLRL